MINPIRLACKVVLCSLFLLLLLQSGRAVVWAGPYWECPCPGECVCIPNAREFGYFQTVWRQWPCKLRSRESFPQSIGAEVLSTPQGQQELPVPKSAVPGRLEGEVVPDALPGEILPKPPLEEGILPGEGGFQIEGQVPGLPSEPAEAPAPEPLPPEGFPGIEEEEPDLPEPLPELPSDSDSPAPSDSGSQEPLPGLRNGEAKLPEKALQANWTAALGPGFRGDAGRTRGWYPATEEQQQAPSAALDSFCPVELSKRERWVPGDPRWTAVHEGRTYWFSGPSQRQFFLVDPDCYIPANSGNDPVLTLDEDRRVAGKTDYCISYDGRLYIFSSEATLASFEKNPKRYTKAERE